MNDFLTLNRTQFKCIPGLRGSFRILITALLQLIIAVWEPIEIHAINIMVIIININPMLILHNEKMKKVYSLKGIQISAGAFIFVSTYMDV